MLLLLCVAFLGDDREVVCVWKSFRDIGSCWLDMNLGDIIMMDVGI